MISDPLPVVCMALGEALPGDYVQRLYAMLRRHCPLPFVLYCCSDQPRDVPRGVRLQLLEQPARFRRAGMRATTQKLRLFRAEQMPQQDFLYLDLTLVIRRLDALLDYAYAQPQDLVIVGDWHHQGYNSSVMRIRPGALRAVSEAFLRGASYLQKVPGDQEFVHACIRELGLAGRVALFPPGMVISYKQARRLSRHDPAAAARQLEQACIVKFHGRPRPHEVLGDGWQGLAQRWRPGGGFGRRELRRHWFGDAAEP